MTIEELLTVLPLETVAGQDGLKREISGGYSSDLLSNVMGQASSGALWVTMQGHQNIVAVAALIDISAVIVAGGASVDSQAILKAQNEHVVILKTSLPVFELVGRLYNLGIHGV